MKNICGSLLKLVLKNKIYNISFLIWLSSLNLNFNKLQYTVLIAYEKQVSYNNPVQIIFLQEINYNSCLKQL